jgi:hypothetical protein
MAPERRDRHDPAQAIPRLSRAADAIAELIILTSDCV